jgi:TolA-binding protein
MEVAVVYWPEGKCVGTTIVWGGEPAMVREVKYTPGYGSSIHIKNWIEGLPEDTAVSEKRLAIRSLSQFKRQFRMRQEQERAELEKTAREEAAAEARAKELADLQRAAQDEAQRRAAEDDRQRMVVAEAAKEHERLERHALEIQRKNEELARAEQAKAKREQAATAKLRLARQFLEQGKRDVALRWLQQAVDEYPGTAAAREAGELKSGLLREQAARD